MSQLPRAIVVEFLPGPVMNSSAQRGSPRSPVSAGTDDHRLRSNTEMLLGFFAFQVRPRPTLGPAMPISPTSSPAFARLRVQIVDHRLLTRLGPTATDQRHGG